jgi:hypothetical protein
MKAVVAVLVGIVVLAAGFGVYRWLNAAAATATPGGDGIVVLATTGPDTFELEPTR